MIRFPPSHRATARVMSLSVTVIFIVVATVAVLRVSAQPQPPPAHRTDLVAVEMGGRVERVSSQHPSHDWEAINLLGTLPIREGAWATRGGTFPRDFPQDLVFSFFGRQPALVAAVVIDLETRNAKTYWAKDVEIWTSMEPADAAFTTVAHKTLADEPGDQTVSFAPVQARFVKIRVTSNWGDKSEAQLGRVKVLEGKAPGYTSMLERFPDLAALISGDPLERIFKVGAGPKAPGPAGPTCDGASLRPPAVAPRHKQSTNVLVLHDRKTYPPVEYADPVRKIQLEPTDAAIYEHVTFTKVAKVQNARPAMLLPENGYDTVVLSQLCDLKTLPVDFRKALSLWVGGGHKLIVQDSDVCNSQPDYSFLPFKIATSNPGARGASSDRLIAVEENSIASTRKEDPSFLDIPNWLASKNGNHNELGDSNTIREYAPEWCGSLFGTNVLHLNGFMMAYAHYGSGLIIYDGFDVDQTASPAYRRLVTRELAQSFDPDGLPCSAHLGDFVIATDQKLKVRPMVPGRTYTYPLTLLSNQGYKGQVSLAATAMPADPGFAMKFDPPNVALTEISPDTFTLTAASTSSSGPHTVAVRGTDAAGKSNTLCLELAPAKVGELSVVSALAPPTKTRKNLEIILDASGSMKTVMGPKKTRWDVALETLDQALGALPDDFNVGLRMYGHREASTSPKTCTDSELLIPIRKLDRKAILAKAKTFKPKGETPLVYSALQAPADLKAVGGGTVILITDGEESCKGDPVAAAATLKASGLDMRLNIVGFAIKNPKTQKDLAGFAQATGGLFYAAQSGATLGDALMLAAIEKFPYTVYDAAGKAVLSSEAGNGADELPPGTYKVVVKAGSKELVAPRVSVALGQQVTLTLAMKNGQLVIQ